MRTKVYNAINLVDLGIKVRTEDGRKVYCHFANGMTYPSFKGGTYTTSDPMVQAAIESSPAYRKLFILEGETYTPGGEPTIPGIFPGGDHGITDELVYHIKNAGQAREWLKANKGATQNDIRNVEAIDEFCTKVKVVFPDWLTIRGK